MQPLMNFPHIHLLLNHWPIIGSFIAFGLLLFSFFKNNEDLRRASYMIFSGIALLTIPTFISGVGAQVIMKRQPGISNGLIQRHEGAAIVALWLMLITGALCLIGLWQGYRYSHPARWNVTAVVLFSLLTLIFVVRTGNTGGDIRHSEDRANPEAPVVDGTFGRIVHVFEPSPTKFTLAVVYSRWITAFLMDLHFIGLALLIGVVGMLDIRIMGFAKQIPVAPLHRFVPWAMAGLAINIVTGMVAFMGSPEYYAFDDAFWLKMFSLMLLGLNVAAFYLTGVFEGIEHLEAGEDAQMSAKLVAASSLLLWAMVIIFGRYIQARDGTLLPPNFS